MTCRAALWTLLVLLGGCAAQRSGAVASTNTPQVPSPGTSSPPAATADPQPDAPNDEPTDTPEPFDEPESVDVVRPRTDADDDAPLDYSYSPPLDKFSRPPPDVQITELTAQGGLDDSVVLEVVKTNFYYMHYCYNQALARNPDQSGDLVISYVISSSGAVTKAKGIKSSLRNKNLVRCAVKASELWAYPEPEDGRAVEVRLSVSFSSPKSDV